MEKNNKHWSNWLIPALLILTTIAFYIFYPDTKTQINNNISKPIDNNAETPLYSPKEIAGTLVSTFFNGSEVDQSEQLKALENTLNHLLISKNDNTKKTLEQLKQNNIYSAIQSLVGVANEQGNLRESAKTWIHIGNIQNLTSAQQALQAYKKASELDANNSNAWNRQGHIHRQLKQFDKAEIAYKKVQALGSQSTANQAFSLANFGLLNQSKGNLDEAEKAFLQALQIYSKIGNDAGAASTSENLASLYKNSEQFEKSELHYLKALEIHQTLEKPQNIATIHIALGSLYQSMKRSNKALDQYEKALEISLNNNFKGNIASLYSNLGILAQQNGKLEKSKQYFEKSLELNQDIKRSNGTADQYGNLAILNRNQKNYATAEDYHLKAIEIYQENKHTHGIISQQINLGFLYRVWKKTNKACQVWKDALINLKQNDNNRLQRVKELIQNNCKL